jgi:hypothetical protein
LPLSVGSETTPRRSKAVQASSACSWYERRGGETPAAGYRLELGGEVVDERDFLQGCLAEESRITVRRCAPSRHTVVPQDAVERARGGPVEPEGSSIEPEMKGSGHGRGNA